MPDTSPDINNLPIDKFYRFAKEICEGQTGQDYFYSTKENKFYHYKDGVWNEIDDKELLKQLGAHIFEIKTKDGVTKVTLNKYNTHYRNEVLRNIEQINNMGLEKINQYPFINLQNGMFDPTGINFLKHDKKYYSTIQIPYSYKLGADCKLWVKTLEEIFENDSRKFNLFQEFIGYCLLPETKQKKALLLMGDTDSGKSTLLFTVRALIGHKNCSTVPLKYFGEAQSNIQMLNKLVNIDFDVSKDALNYETEFKLITSGDPIQGKILYSNSFDFIPYCKIILAANAFPKIKDHSSAFYNRLLLIPLERRFMPVEQNKNLEFELREELPGILNWAIEGLKHLKKRGLFEQHTFMKEAVQELEDENNPINGFFEEHIEEDVSNGIYIEKGELYEKYKSWAQRTNNYPLSTNRFSTAVFKKYHNQTPKHAQHTETHKRIWKNLRYVEFKIEKEEIEIPPYKTASPSTIAAGEGINWEE